MPTPISPYNIALKLTGGTGSNNEVLFRNGTTGEFKKVKSTNTEAIVNIGELSSDGLDSGTKSGYSNGDIIEISVTGRRFGGTHHTVNTGARGGGVKLTVSLTDVSTTNAPAVSI